MGRWGEGRKQKRDGREALKQWRWMWGEEGVVKVDVGRGGSSGREWLRQQAVDKELGRRRRL